MKLDLRLPTQDARGFARVALKTVNLPGAEVTRIDFDIFLPVELSIGKSILQEFANAMGLPCGDDEVVSTVKLHHAPHGVDIFWRESPVTFGVKISHVELFLKTRANPSHSSGNLAAYKRLSPPRRFMIEQNSVAGE